MGVLRKVKAGSEARPEDEAEVLMKRSGLTRLGSRAGVLPYELAPWVNTGLPPIGISLLTPVRLIHQLTNGLTTQMMPRDTKNLGGMAWLSKQVYGSAMWRYSRVVSWHSIYPATG